MLTKSQLIDELVARGAGERRHVSNMLKHLAEVASDQVEAGEDFTVPGIAKISWRYRKAQKKGERWLKGQEVTGFGGEVSVKDADSPPVKPQARLAASVTGLVAKHKVQTRPEVQAEFLKTKAGRTIAKRKG